jgi:hypothetical protein
MSVRRADDADVVAAMGVVTTTAAEDMLPDQFFEAFASALAQHRRMGPRDRLGPRLIPSSVGPARRRGFPLRQIRAPGREQVHNWRTDRSKEPG